MIGNLNFKIKNYLPKSQKNNRIIKISLCFIIAFILTASIFIAAQKQNKVITVIKPSKYITSGTKIKDSDLKEVEVGEYGLPDNTIISKDKIVGMYAKSDLYTSDFITNEKLTTKKAESFITLKKDEKIMSFTVSNLAASVASNIKIGDKIQIIYSVITMDELGINSNSEILSPECLKQLTVIDIKDVNGYKQNGDKKDKNLYSNTSFIPSVITVAVNEEQAQELYKAELSKNIYVIFVER